jgi:hypothetical protein
MPAGPAPTGTGPLTPPESGSTRETVSSWLLATQTAWSPTAMPSGSPPTSMFLFVTRPVAGSIRSTVPSPWLATQTPLGPLAMATGTFPTGILSPTTAPAAVLIRVTVASPLLVTHTSVSVTVSAVGCEPTGMVWTTAWVAGLIRVTVRSALFTTHTEPAPYARPAGLPTGTGAPVRRPDSLITPTLLAGRPVGPGAHGRVTARMHAATTTINAEPMATSRRPRPHVAPAAVERGVVAAPVRSRAGSWARTAACIRSSGSPGSMPSSSASRWRARR